MADQRHRHDEDFGAGGRGSTRQAEKDQQRPLIEDSTTTERGDVEKENSRLSFSQRWSGWKFGVITGSVASIVVFVINLAFTLWGLGHRENEDGIRTLYEGDCEKVHQLSVGGHLLINILSTILLSASNYCMQCLSAPTRRDVDKAHSKGLWLDIGISSVRNLTRIPKRKCILWIFLVLSSLPLHLLYNSAIFSTKSAHPYLSLTVNEAFRTSTALNIQDNRPEVNRTLTELHRKALNDELEHLDNSACINAYGQTYQSTYGSVLLITDDINTTSCDVSYSDVIPPKDYPESNCSNSSPFDWICKDSGVDDPCPARCDPVFGTTDTCPARGCYTYLPEISKASEWIVKGKKVKYCLSERIPQHCKLQYNLPFAVSVTVSNFIKAVIMFYFAFSANDCPLMTMGDAVASFMEIPDEATKGQCLLSKKTVCGHVQVPISFSSRRQRLGSAASWRWTLCLASYYVAISVCIILLTYGACTMGSDDLTSLWMMGFGGVNLETLVGKDYWPSSVILNALVANAAQSLFSVLYLVYNGLFTSMTLGEEWSQYAVSRKGLRVSNPQGSQRGTYFLSLPYRYAIPLIVISATMHWIEPLGYANDWPDL